MKPLSVKLISVLAAGTLALAGSMATDSPASATPRSTRDVPKLSNAPVPGGMCGHPRGHLSHGKRDFGRKGGDSLSKVARGELGGGAVAVVAIDCSAGGVNWPQTIVFYGKDRDGAARMLGYVGLQTFRTSEHATVTSMFVTDGALNIAWATYEGCCFEQQNMSARMHLEGRNVVVSNLSKGPITNPYKFTQP